MALRKRSRSGHEDYPMHDIVADALKGAKPEKPVYDAVGFSV